MVFRCFVFTVLEQMFALFALCLLFLASDLCQHLPAVHLDNGNCVRSGLGVNSISNNLALYIGVTDGEE